MIKFKKFLSIPLIALLLLQFNIVKSSIPEIKSLSPYFMIIGNDSIPRPDVSLYSTDVDVTISGVIADVTVKQEYRNNSATTVEAIYVFPASTRAAVYAMEMKIGKRIIKAEIKEKGEARKIYEQAKSEGRHTSLLEQDRPNLFKMNVANIKPGDKIEVIMKYTELLVPEDAIYSFIYPRVVGPRYGDDVSPENIQNSPPSGPPQTRIMHNNEDGKIIQPPIPPVENSKFTISVNLLSPVPIGIVESETYEIKVKNISENQKEVTLKQKYIRNINDDYVLNYQLAGKKINSGLMVYDDGKEDFFLLTIQAPKRIIKANLPPREYMFVLDVSGSMNGFPEVISKKLIINMIKDLRPIDKFNLILFAGTFNVFSETFVNGSKENIINAIEFTASQGTGGGTELLPALEKALSYPQNDNVSRSVVVLTDGLVSFETKAFDMVRNNLDKQNVFCFGIGSSTNRHIIEGIAHSGLGESDVVMNADDANEAAEKFQKYISSPVMTNIKVTYHNFETEDVEPSIIPDLFAEKPIVIYGKYDGVLAGYVQVEGIAGNDKILARIDVSKFAVKTDNEALKYLWARKKLQLYSDYASLDYNNKHKKEITDLALKYNLLSKYTSFVAVDNEEKPINYGADEIQIRADGMNVTNAPLSAGVQSSGQGFSVRNSRSKNSPRSMNYEGKPSGITRLLRYLFEKEPDYLPLSYDETEFKKHLIYPKSALQQGLEGYVVIQVTVDNKGKVINTNVTSSRNEIFNEAAINAIKKIKFTPQREDGKYVEAKTSIYVYFNLPETYDFYFDNRTYKMKRYEEGRYPFSAAIINKGGGKKINSIDNVKIEYTLYDEFGKKIAMGKADGMLGIGEFIKSVDTILGKMNVNGEAMILFKRNQLSTGMKPKFDYKISNKGKVLRIKVLEAK